MVTRGVSTFVIAPDSYEAYMGAWSRPLAKAFSAAAGVRAGDQALDVGCGTGALTEALVECVENGTVAAVDPSPPFVQACAAAAPRADVRLGGAEALPWAWFVSGAR
jgi:ubiquinone/menaquinone biosynthesis C-methylase UbiE